MTTSVWQDCPTRLRMIRKDETFTLELVDGIRGTVTERVKIPWADF